MGRELWAELSALISLVDLDFPDNPDVEHATATIVRCHLWSAFNDRPTAWSVVPGHWDRPLRPRVLPSQSTMSRRLRSPAFDAFMRELERRVGHRPDASTLFKRLDAKTLAVAAHSGDPHAGWGRGAGQLSNGYKLHVIWARRAMPLTWRIAPLNVSEQEMARRMLRELSHLPGHVSADAGYDANLLFAAARASGNVLLTPRRRPGTSLGHRVHAADRCRSRELLEGSTATLSGMGASSRRDRVQVERDLGNLVSFGGGLNGLPSRVRRHGRVRRWVWAKLLINAARIRRKSRCVA